MMLPMHCLCVLDAEVPLVNAVHCFCDHDHQRVGPCHLHMQPVHRGQKPSELHEEHGRCDLARALLVT
jgi:hypothetical protein